MFRRIFMPAVLSVTLVLCSLTIVSAQSATPPVQPQTGPGGKQYLHAGVTKNRYGTGGKEYWIFEPDSPKPRTAPGTVTCWGRARMTFAADFLAHKATGQRADLPIFCVFAMNGPAIGKALGVPGTSRNLRTVEKLIELAGS